MSDVVLATRNAGKLKEMRALFAPLGWNLISQAELDIESAPEEADTFIENALAKARFVAARTQLPCIADDSGLVVDALDGQPGIYSARYAGAEATDAANNRKLIDALSGVDNREAHFYCAMVYLAHASHPAPIVATASWPGRIVDQPRGENGFGYDPYFYLPALSCTSAELPAEQKNTLSHRGQAARLLFNQLANGD